MEYIVIIVFLIVVLILLKIIVGYNKKEIKQIAENKELDEMTEKYPDNIEICKEYLEMLKNEDVKIEEDKQAINSLYIAIFNKILIANVRNSFTRIQTIAHECLHSIQNRKMLMFNFIYSNLYILYFIIISLLTLLGILPYKMMFLVILIMGGFIYYFIRSYLENDAMIKARFLAKEYMENKKISTQKEIDIIVKEFDKLNNIGIKSTNYLLFSGVIIQIIIFCIISFLAQV